MRTWQQLKQNPLSWDRYFVREKVIKAIRTFFEQQQFHEIETPILIKNPPAESYLDVFETTLLDRQRHPSPMYLSTSPEVALKKLIVAGLGNCYSLTKSFRNMETQSKLHTPEFTILEWYRIGAGYGDIMNDCEKLVESISQNIYGKKIHKLTYQGKIVDLQAPWERISVAESFRKYAGVSFNDFFHMEYARDVVIKKGYQVGPDTTWEQLYNQIFLNEVEPCLGQGKPTILYDFPGSMAALAKKKDSDPRYAERFEFYIGGLELGDCYSELTDWKEQEERFNNELAELHRLGKTTYDYDHDFITALKEGLPKCSGIAVGIDRLVMLFADTDDIRETLFFPVND